MEKNNEFLLDNSLMVSMIDGSLIDLKSKPKRSLQELGSKPKANLSPFLSFRSSCPFLQESHFMKRSSAGFLGASNPRPFPPFHPYPLSIEGGERNAIRYISDVFPNLKRVKENNNLVFLDQEKKRGVSAHETMKTLSKKVPSGVSLSDLTSNLNVPTNDSIQILIKSPIKGNLKTPNLCDNKQKEEFKAKQIRKFLQTKGISKNIQFELPDYFDLKLLNQKLIFLYQTKGEKPIFAKEKKKLIEFFKNSDIKVQDLQRFYFLLEKFLKNETISEFDLRLSKFEKVLFCIFIIKKKFRAIMNFEWTAASLTDLRERGVIKRSEQNCKIILKRFFRLSIKDFLNKRGLGPSQEEEFYRHYFSKIASKHGYDWKKLKFELVFNEVRIKTSLSHSQKPKKMFGKILSQSSTFIKMLNDYLGNRLLVSGETHGITIDYMPTLDKKTWLLSNKWSRFFGNKKNVSQTLCEFALSQLKNNRIKLPWGVSEINHAIKSVKKLFGQN